MTDHSEPRRASFSIVYLLFALVAVLAGQQILMLFNSSRRDTSDLPPSESDTAYTLISGVKYIASDRDKDGTVDCFIPTGFSSITGTGVYYAKGFRWQCSQVGLMSIPMKPDLRAMLTQMVELKFELDATYTSAVDRDKDGTVDCFVNVHNPDIVVAPLTGAMADGQVVDPSRRDNIAALPVLEERIRRTVTEDR